MKKKYKIFLVLLSLLLFLSISVVSASDNANPTTIHSLTKTTPHQEKVATSTEGKNIIKEVKKLNNTNKEINKNNKTNINTKTESITVNTDNYETLSNALASSDYDTVTINITDNITLTGNNTINSTIKTLTINGNQKTINGDNKYQFLSIDSAINININNIIITNCTAYTGGAIYNSNGNLTITNSTLTHNTASLSGGAIATVWNANMNLTGNNITNNNVIPSDYGSHGGAIYNTGNMTLTLNNITHNNANTRGGAIDNNGGNMNLTMNNITNNTAENGGAIYNSWNMNLTHNNITNNTAENGGAIYNTGDLDKNENNMFKDNTPANFVIEDNFIKLTNANGFITVGDFNLIIDDAMYIGNGIEDFKNYPISPYSRNVKLILDGNDTKTYKNTFIILKESSKTPTNMSVEVLDATYGNVTIMVTVSDDNGTPVSMGNVTVYDINGSIINGLNEKVLLDGKIRLLIPSDDYKPEDDIIITVKYNENIYYLGCSNVNLSATPESPTYNKTNITVAKIPTSTTLSIPNTQVDNVTVKGTVYDKYGRKVNEGTITIKNGNNTIGTTNIKDGKYDILTSIVNKGTYTLTAEYTGTNTYQSSKSQTTTINVTTITPLMTVNTTGSSVGKINVTATIKDSNNNPIRQVPVTATLPDGTIKTTLTDNMGKTVIPLDLREGNNNITIEYKGNETYSPVKIEKTINVTKNTPIITLQPVRGSIGEKITLNAYLNDSDGTPITGGNLVFKLNGKTLRSDGRFDSKASAMKFNVKDGLVTYTINADLYLRNAKNLTASYSGNYKYKETSSPTVEAQIQKRNATITVTATSTSLKQYNTIKLTATIHDSIKNNTLIYENTSVIFKINGNTLKDNNGNVVHVPVEKNLTATYNYIIPAGTSAVNNNNQTRNYSVETVFVGDNYYPGARNTTTFQVERSPITIDISNITVNKNNLLNINADIKDYKTKNVVGDNKISIKINGKTYTDKNNKAVYWKVTDGKINLTEIQVDSTTKIKRVMIVTGERQAYTSGRTETTNIIAT